ncbi:glycosyltransferase [Streptomyces sp. NPDC059740]|uniref:glycosyltransferase n=1 Tax=Streptomyces sp. NPDC059740 TaxID=3346926 RepID=UPI003660C511
MVSEHASPLAALGGADAGGQNVYVAELSAHLARRGHQVTVYTRRDDPELPERVVTAEGFDVVHVTAGPAAPLPKDELWPLMPAFGDRLATLWAQQPPDIAHAHFWMSGTAALRGAQHLPTAVVQTYHALGTVKRRHQGTEDTSPAARVATETRIARESDAVIATCSDEVAELAAMGVPTGHVTVVPCGVDADHFAPVTPDASTGPATGVRRRLLAVGRLVPRKGFDRAVRALKHVPDTELLIAGGPAPDRLPADPEAVRLLKTAVEHGVADRVTLLGGVGHQDMPRLMSGADLVLSIPWYEPFGIVPLEAMACRTPVLATAVGGQLDTVTDGVTGVLVPPGDEPALVRALTQLLTDPDRLIRLGAAGRQRVLERYTWDRVTDGVTRVYHRLAAAPTPTGDHR